MSSKDVTLAKTSSQEGLVQEPEMVRSEGGCCLPVFDACGPETCGLPLTGAYGTEHLEPRPTSRDKIVKLTPAGAERLFNGGDDEIYSREDLIEAQPDGSIKVRGACTGTIWLVQVDEIAAIVDA